MTAPRGAILANTILLVLILSAVLVAVVEIVRPTTLPALSSENVPSPVPTLPFTGTSGIPTLPIATPTIHVSNTPVVLRQRDMGGWQYTLTQSDWLRAEIVFDQSSVGAIRAYGEANRRLAVQLATITETVEIDITFNSYLQPEQYKAWVEEKALNVQWTSVRALDVNGLRSTLALKPRENDVLPSASLLNPRIPTVQGVYLVYATVQSNMLQSIISDPLVAIPDVTKTILRRDIADIISNPDAVEISLGSPFWFMEDFGLHNFR